jgi:CarboxypepD_reg-like domain/TonB-dependent Receptor Plug Domain
MRETLKIMLLTLLLAGPVVSFGQHVLDAKLDGSEQGQPLVDYLNHFEQNHRVKFFFLKEWFDQTKIQTNYAGISLRDALTDLLHGTDITFVELYDYAVIFSKDPAGALERESLIRNTKGIKGSLNAIVLGNQANYQLGKMIDISGVVTDNKVKEPMAGVTVVVGDINQQITTAHDGRYRISVPSGEHVLIYRYLNYEEKVFDVKAYENGVINVDLLEAPRMLDEVVISDQHINPVSGRIGQTNLKMVDIKKMPTFLGEVDIIKQIQMLPGVTTVGEVSSGFNVRGGGVDQNLVLYDGSPVFNNSHVFGFFSTFNSEAIKDASFYKGGIPAEYGGRVSSVLNVNSKEGNYKNWEASGGIGLIASSLSVGGPIKKDVSSVQISVRSSYSDWLLHTFTSSVQNINKSSVSFYDASIKLTDKLSEKDKISFSAYSSKDHFGLPTDTTFVWQNNLASLRLDHVFNEKSFSTVTLGFGQYAYQVTDKDPATAYKMNYRINYPSLRMDYNYQAGLHKISVGVNSLFYKIAPGSIQPESKESSIVPVTVPNNQSLENAVFISDGFEWNDRIHVDAGFRMSMFSSLGPSTVYQYQPGLPKSNETIVDSITYKSGQVIKNYFGPEPRLAMRYSLNSNSSLKLSYNHMYQYIHLISNSAAVTPIDIWQPSNYYFKPQIADQVSLGYFRSLKEGKADFSVEGFYKHVQNILDFKDGSSLVLNPTLEQALLPGVAKSYGVEFAFNKTIGRLTGTLNYTFSRSLRKVVGATPEETINHGNYYPSNYDQPNIINLNWKYGLSRRFYFTGNFTYRTGRPVTVPYSYTTIDNIPIVNFSDRNQYRVPDYHRLDLAIVMEGNHRRKKLLDGTWVLSIYNVYARKNVYTIFYQKNPSGLQEAYQMSIIGTILPSLSYKFKI